MVDLPDGLVMWVDEALLIVNKPAGLPTLVDGYHPEAAYLVGLLKTAYDPLWVVHRLDRDTSGAMVFARRAAAHRSLNTQFEKRQASKCYHALALGEPSWEEKTVDLPLRANGDRRHRTIVDRRGGKTSCTQLRVLEHFKGCVLVEATPLTGRTHQIRAHLAALGHPVATDVLYGGEAQTWMKRLALHALSLAFYHPTHNERMTFEAPYPADFSNALRHLRAGILSC
jgi:tRNA pseudouridine32 synthase/23S rRNA pseudouridine746 synthase